MARLLGEFRDWWGYAEPSDDALLDSIGRILADGSGEYLLDAEDGVCQLRYRWSVWTGAPDCWLEDLYVREAARGRGVGRALVRAAVDRAVERGCRRIELDVNEQNDAALALYVAEGFKLEPKPPGRTLFVSRRLG